MDLPEVTEPIGCTGRAHPALPHALCGVCITCGLQGAQGEQIEPQAKREPEGTFVCVNWIEAK